MSESKSGVRAYSFVGINDYVEIKTGKMSELTKCASCGTTLRMPNDNCVLHSSQQGLAIEAFEKRVADMKVKELEKFQCQCSPDETTGWMAVNCCNICGKPVEKFWKEVKN